MQCKAHMRSAPCFSQYTRPDTRPRDRRDVILRSSEGREKTTKRDRKLKGSPAKKAEAETKDEETEGERDEEKKGSKSSDFTKNTGSRVREGLPASGSVEFSERGQIENADQRQPSAVYTCFRQTRECT